MELANLMKKIPEEIIVEHICPYLYQPQSKELCEDIKSFVYTKNHLYNLYFSKYSLRKYNRQWLLSDICRFINGYNSYYFRYSNFFYSKMKVLFMLRNKKIEYLYKFIITLEHKLPPEMGIHIKLGILNPHERYKLIDYVKYVENIH